MLITILSYCATLGAGISIGYLIATRNKHTSEINPDVKDILQSKLEENDDIVVIHKNLVTKSSSDYEHNKWVIEGKLYCDE